MSDIAISVQSLSKRYRLGLKEKVPDTFVGALTSWLKSPLANYRQLHKLSDFRDDPLDKQGHELGATPEDVLYALRDVSFDIKKGEVVGIIGRNGAGKSTLLKILSRITEPTSGRVEVHGRVASLLEVGTGFHPELTGRENIYLNGTILGMRKAEIDRKFDEIVAFSEIEKFLDTPVKRYSSGMYVRLAFAVAAHLEPEILIVDEVLAVGDAAFQRKCLGKMGEVSSSGRTILFVSHQLGSVRALCDSGIYLGDGTVRAMGPIEDVLLSYAESVRGSEGLRSAAVKAKHVKSALFCGEAAGQSRQTIPIGGSASILVNLSLPRPTRLPVVGVIARRSDTGEMVFGSNSRICGDLELAEPTTQLSVVVSIERISLVPGSYLLDIWVGCGSEDIEGVSGMLELEVIDNDPSATGKPTPANFGACFVPMRFQARSISG